MDDFVQEVEKESRKLAIDYGLPHGLVRSILIRGIGISTNRIFGALNEMASKEEEKQE
jgi:hypothetical protein